MDALRAGNLCDFDQPIDREIAFARLRRTDEVGFITDPTMERMSIRGRINSDRAHPEPFRGAGYAASDFAAVGDKDRAEHHRRLAASAWLTLNSLRPR